MKKYIVITTINPITSGVKSLLDNDYNLVIVGDLKSPNEYQDSEDIFFLDINKQKELFGFSSISPKFNFKKQIRQLKTLRIISNIEKDYLKLLSY